MDCELTICGSNCVVITFHVPRLLVCGDELEGDLLDVVKMPMFLALISSLFLFLPFSWSCLVVVLKKLVVLIVLVLKTQHDVIMVVVGGG